MARDRPKAGKKGRNLASRKRAPGANKPATVRHGSKPKTRFAVIGPQGTPRPPGGFFAKMKKRGEKASAAFKASIKRKKKAR